MAALISRRGFGMGVVGAVALAGFGHGAAAQNAKYRLRYGTAFPADHPGVKRIQDASAAIAKESGGQVDLQVYPNSQLGSEPDMFSQVRSGALDFMSTSGVNQTVVPVGGINAVAFAFDSYDKVWAAMDGDLGANQTGDKRTREPGSRRRRRSWRLPWRSRSPRPRPSGSRPAGRGPESR